MITDRGIMVKCKNCGASTGSNELVLDLDYEMMVCPECVKQKKQSKDIHEEINKERDEHKLKIHMDEDKKPKDWDSEDDYLERSHKQREQASVNVKRIDNEKVQYTCPKCKYKFPYNTVKKTPTKCPYCSMEVQKFNSMI